MARPDCCMAQGTAKIEVPIIVFQIDNLKTTTLHLETYTGELGYII